MKRIRVVDKTRGTHAPGPYPGFSGNNVETETPLGTRLFQRQEGTHCYFPLNAMVAAH